MPGAGWSGPGLGMTEADHDTRASWHDQPIRGQECQVLTNQRLMITVLLCWPCEAPGGDQVWCCDTSLSLTDTQREARVFRWECRTLGGLLIIMTPRPDYWCDTQMWLFFHHRHDISCGEIWLLRFVYCILVWLSCHGLMISVNSHYFYISHE